MNRGAPRRPQRRGRRVFAEYFLLRTEEIQMVKHVIIWTLKEESDERKAEIKKGIKTNLEGLAGKIPGLIEIKVNTEPLASSNSDVILECLFENEESLNGYSVNPAHVAVAQTYVRPYTATRNCMDYEI